MIGPMYVGQVPARPFSLTVRDAATNSVVDLSDYLAATVTVVDPEGTKLLDAVAATISDAINGVVTFTWPTTTAIATTGDHKLQVSLTGQNTADLTVPIVFEVFAALGS